MNERLLETLQTLSRKQRLSEMAAVLYAERSTYGIKEAVRQAIEIDEEVGKQTGILG